MCAPIEIDIVVDTAYCYTRIQLEGRSFIVGIILVDITVLDLHKGGGSGCTLYQS